MSNTIQPNYGTQTYSTPIKTHKMKQVGTQDGSFFDLSARAGTNDVLEINSTESAQQETELSEAEEMQLFKKEFYSDLEKLGVDRTISNVAINISEEAFKNMKADPEYREKVLAVIRRDLSASVAPAPNCSLLITVGATLKDYRADSWSVGNDSEFHLRSKNSFYKRTSDGRDRKKELLEEYQEKKLQAKRRRQKLLDKAARDRQRLAQIGAQEKSFSGIADLLKTRITATPFTTPETSLSAGTDVP